MPTYHRPGEPIQRAPNPCGQQRPAWDVAGRINDLINCYLYTAGAYVRAYLPQVIIALILLGIMFIAAREFIKE